jgi:hypothetical protein
MKIYLDTSVTPLMNYAISHALPFGFDQRFVFTDDKDQTDIVPIIFKYTLDLQEQQFEYFSKLFDHEKPTILLNLFHDSEEDGDKKYEYYRKNYKNLIITTTYYNSEDAVFYDFLWNRTKGAYRLGYINLDLLKESIWLLHLDLDIFELDFKKNIEYNILCANRGYYNSMPTMNRLKYRYLLNENLKDKSNVLLSDPDNGIMLKTSNWKSGYDLILRQGGRYTPIDPDLYNKSFVSAYVESIAVSKLENGHCQINRSITEKTWEPLLKGHFILPFSTPGHVKELSKRGFKFPEFIDYSYTDINDDDKRYGEFTKQLESLTKLSSTECQRLYESNEDIIFHNRGLFNYIPYDCLYTKIVEHISI